MLDRTSLSTPHPSDTSTRTSTGTPTSSPNDGGQPRTPVSVRTPDPRVAALRRRAGDTSQAGAGPVSIRASTPNRMSRAGHSENADTKPKLSYPAPRAAHAFPFAHRPGETAAAIVRRADSPQEAAMSVDAHQRAEQGRASYSSAASASPTANRPETYKTLSPPFGSFAAVPGIVGVAVPADYRDDPRLGPIAKEWMAEPYVRGRDGVVRRFPPSGGLNSNYLQQLRQGVIYDGPPENVTHRFAGFGVSEDHQQAAFMIDNYPVSSIKAGEFSVYPLPGGKHMVPQPGFSDCTYACELMLLLDRGKVDLSDNAKLPAGVGVRGDTHHLIASLKDRPGCEPLVVPHTINYGRNWFGKQDESRQKAWRDLKDKIDQFGPCIMEKGSHVVMLDNIREENGAFFLTIRDPFHGANVELRDSAALFGGLGGKSDSAIRFTAIFLREQQPR